jgi:hypothetical protein
MNAINEENIYYKYKDLETNNSESYLKTAYEKKLRMISDTIYPEYKKGKGICELSNNYNLESYLIEEYIQKIETKQSDNNLNVVEICNDKQTYCDIFYIDKITELGNKLITLEQKLDYIISIISK